MAAPGGRTVAVRGHAITYTGDPFFDESAFVDVEDALIISTDGVITAFGSYEETKSQLPEGVEVTHYSDAPDLCGIHRHPHPLRADGDHRRVRLPADRLAEPLHVHRGAALR